MIFKIAWRNLWRHRTRTLIMTSAVAIAYALMLVMMGIADDGHGRMLEEAARAAGGDVLVHGKDYWATRASDITIPDGAAVMDRVQRVAGVETAIPRIIISGLVSTSTDNRAVMLEGVDPEREQILNDKLAGDIVAGTFLAPGERRDPLVLGSRLAERLDVGIGDRVVLTATGPDGELTRALFHLTGILETGTRELDEFMGYTTLDAARVAVNMDGMLTQVGVLLDPGAEPDTVAARIAAAVHADSAGLEVLTWRQAVPEMVGFVEIDDAFGYIYLAVIYFVVLFSITNTFLMAVMERVREFGLLNALGLKGGRIGQLLLTESALMTGLAIIIGFLLGFSGHLAAAHWGIPISSYGMTDIEISGIDFADMVMYSRIVPLKWIMATIIVGLATVASAVYPAWRASRLAPAEAMRFYE